MLDLVTGTRNDRVLIERDRHPIGRQQIQMAAVLRAGGYEFRWEPSLQGTRGEASAAFSIPSGAERRP